MTEMWDNLRKNKFIQYLGYLIVIVSFIYMAIFAPETTPQKECDKINGTIIETRYEILDSGKANQIDSGLYYIDYCLDNNIKTLKVDYDTYFKVSTERTNNIYELESK